MVVQSFKIRHKLDHVCLMGSLLQSKIVKGFNFHHKVITKIAVPSDRTKSPKSCYPFISGVLDLYVFSFKSGASCLC